MQSGQPFKQHSGFSLRVREVPCSIHGLPLLLAGVSCVFACVPKWVAAVSSVRWVTAVQCALARLDVCFMCYGFAFNVMSFVCIGLSC